MYETQTDVTEQSTKEFENVSHGAAAAPQQREEEEKEEEQQAARTKLMHTVQALHLENQRLRRDMADVRQEVCFWDGAGRRESIRNHVTVYDLHTRVSTTDTH